MIERASEFGPSTPAPQISTEGAAAMTAGQMLQRAREANGLHIEMMAGALKVPVQKLMALEADNIDALPDPVFARALAASMARALRIDPAPVLEKLPGAPRAVLAEADRSMSGNISEQAARHSSRSGVTGRPSRALWSVVALLLLGALVLFLLPTSLMQSMSTAWGKLTASAEGTVASAPVSAGDGLVVEAAQPLVPQVAQPAEEQAAPTQEAAPVTNPAAVAPAEPAAVPALTAEASAVLVFTAKGESWIRVAGPGNRTVLERTLKDGESASVPGTEQGPLSVIVGRASVIQVQLRGEAFDLAPITRSGGVARFEVKP